jgi:hypothetical protein
MIYHTDATNFEPLMKPGLDPRGQGSVEGTVPMPPKKHPQARRTTGPGSQDGPNAAEQEQEDDLFPAADCGQDRCARV